MNANESNAVESNATPAASTTNEAPPVNRPEIQISVNYRGVDGVGNLQFPPSVSNGERENVLSELQRIGQQAGRITGAIFRFTMVTPQPVPPPFSLTDDEKETVVALREGKAKVVLAKPPKPAKQAKAAAPKKAPAEKKAKPAKPAKKKPAKKSELNT